MCKSIRGAAVLPLVCMVVVTTAAAAHAQRADCSGGGPYSPTAITNMYNTSTNTETNATIWAEVAAASGDPNGAWGGSIIGLYYRASGTGSWGANLVDDWDTGREIQTCLYNGPGSQYDWSDTCRSFWDWNPTQAGNRAGVGSPSTVTGSGLSPVPWTSVQTAMRDWASEYADCMVVNRTIWMQPTHLEVRDSFVHQGNCTKTGAYHPTHQQDVPCVFAYPGTTNDDTMGLTDEATYNGNSSWNPDYANDPPSQDLVPQPTGILEATAYLVYSTENWLGLYRHWDDVGITLAYPSRPYHQPWPFAYWFLVQAGGSGLPNLEFMTSRPYFDVNPSTSGETITCDYYIIPGTAYQGRDTAYCLLPHRRWEFNHGTAHEGWINGGNMTNLRVVSGALTGGANATDPLIISLDQLDLASDSFSGITVRMKLPSGANNSAAIYYMTEEDPTWNEAKKKAFTTTPDGTYHTYEVLLSDVTGWAGKTVKRLRIDPVAAGPCAADSIQIDYMRLWDTLAWEFNAAGNNEGWTPVTYLISDPVWPNNVAGGIAAFHTERNADGWFPAIYGPYPVNVAPSPTRHVDVRMRFVRGAGENISPFTPRLYYTLQTDDKVRTGSRFASHTPITGGSVPANGQWYVITFTLPTTGTIDQFRIDPTGIGTDVGKRGTLSIDYIRVIM